MICQTKKNNVKMISFLNKLSNILNISHLVYFFVFQEVVASLLLIIVLNYRLLTIRYSILLPVIFLLSTNSLSFLYVSIKYGEVLKLKRIYYSFTQTQAIWIYFITIINNITNNSLIGI